MKIVKNISNFKFCGIIQTIFINFSWKLSILTWNIWNFWNQHLHIWSLLIRKTEFSEIFENSFHEIFNYEIVYLSSCSFLRRNVIQNENCMEIMVKFTQKSKCNILIKLFLKCFWSAFLIFYIWFLNSAQNSVRSVKNLGVFTSKKS